MENIIVSVTQFVLDLPAALQFFAVFIIGVVPFLESYVGALVGIVVGVPVVLAAIAAIAGTCVAVLGAAVLGSRVARRRDGLREMSERQRRIIARVDRYGVPLASLLAPTILAISVTTFVMVVAGLNRRQVIVWNMVAGLAWGVLFALIGIGAVEFVPPSWR